MQIHAHMCMHTHACVHNTHTHTHTAPQPLRFCLFLSGESRIPPPPGSQNSCWCLGAAPAAVQVAGGAQAAGLGRGAGGGDEEEGEAGSWWGPCVGRGRAVSLTSGTVPLGGILTHWAPLVPGLWADVRRRWTPPVGVAGSLVLGCCRSSAVYVSALSDWSSYDKRCLRPGGRGLALVHSEPPQRHRRAISLLSSFTPQALGSFYFLHESLKNIYQFDFKGKSLCCRPPQSPPGVSCLDGRPPPTQLPRGLASSGGCQQCPRRERTGRSGCESLAGSP